MAEMTKKISVLLGAAEAEWLESESKRIDRPQSFVVRRLILLQTTVRSIDQTTDIYDVVAPMPSEAA